MSQSELGTEFSHTMFTYRVKFICKVSVLDLHQTNNSESLRSQVKWEIMKAFPNMALHTRNYKNNRIKIVQGVQYYLWKCFHYILFKVTSQCLNAFLQAKAVCVWESLSKQCTE